MENQEPKKPDQPDITPNQQDSTPKDASPSSNAGQVKPEENNEISDKGSPQSHAEQQVSASSSEQSAQPATPPATGTGEEAFMANKQREIEQIRDAVEKIKQEVSKVIVGQDQMIDLLLTGLFTGGHVLLEGVPGIAKTLTAKLLAKTLKVGFSRIQFTPDLMPTDVVGTTVFNMKNSEFTFNRGPIFSNIILIDEINRAPAKTQAALFEVMEERQVTMDGNTYPMDFPFIVIATQNPIEQEGTYKLPEAQLDRFLFRVRLNYPSLDEETSILKRFRSETNTHKEDLVQGVLGSAELRKCRDIISRVHIEDSLLSYIANIIHKTRNNGDLFLGASPRASLAIMNSSKAIAAMRGRDFVTPDDIKFVAIHVLNHRMILSPEKEMEGVPIDEVVNDIVKSVEVPR